MPYINSGGAGGLQGKEIGYDQITASVNVVSAVEATGTTIITCAAHVFDGSAVMVEFFALVTCGSADLVGICLFEGVTEITRLALVNQAAASGANITVPSTGSLRFTPTAASHSYVVTAFHGSAGGTISAGSGGTGGTPPAFIRFTKA